MSSAQSSSSRSPTGPEGVVLSYRMHVSQKYLELTKKKLELTRLPREPQTRQPGRWNLGLSKTELEPLVDHWMEEYSWREQEVCPRSLMATAVWHNIASFRRYSPRTGIFQRYTTTVPNGRPGYTTTLRAQAEHITERVAINIRSWLSRKFHWSHEHD